MTHEPSPDPFSWAARGRSFLFAARGLRVLIATQHNARLHFAATLAAFVLGVGCRLNRFEWIAVAAAVGIVWVAETANTAVERLGDAVTRDYHPAVRDAKDLAAGAVLAASATSAAIGLLVFAPHLAALWLRFAGR
jgi:diacylglycerol kinase (ATP)